MTLFRIGLGAALLVLASCGGGGSVDPSPPVVVAPSIEYGASSYTFTTGVPAGPLAPENSGGDASSWSIDPALPDGLTFDTDTGEVSGEPDVVADSADYVVTASNARR